MICWSMPLQSFRSESLGLRISSAFMLRDCSINQDPSTTPKQSINQTRDWCRVSDLPVKYTNPSRGLSIMLHTKRDVKSLISISHRQQQWHCMDLSTSTRITEIACVSWMKGRLTVDLPRTCWAHDKKKKKTPEQKCKMCHQSLSNRIKAKTQWCTDYEYA